MIPDWPKRLKSAVVMLSSPLLKISEPAEAVLPETDGAAQGRGAAGRVTPRTRLPTPPPLPPALLPETVLWVRVAMPR